MSYHDDPGGWKAAGMGPSLCAGDGDPSGWKAAGMGPSGAGQRMMRPVAEPHHDWRRDRDEPWFGNPSPCGADLKEREYEKPRSEVGEKIARQVVQGEKEVPNHDWMGRPRSNPYFGSPTTGGMHEKELQDQRDLIREAVQLLPKKWDSSSDIYPHKCPVCDGRGTVMAGFYVRVSSERSLEREACNSCQGTGILYYSGP